MRIRVMLLAAATVAATVVPGAAAAAAARTAGASSTPSWSCGDDVCLNVVPATGGAISVRACLEGHSYRAEFNVTGPAKLNAISKVKIWPVTSHHCTGTDKYFSVTRPDKTGKYCAMGYAVTGIGNIPIGFGCVRHTAATRPGARTRL